MWPLDVQYVLHPYITTAERRFNKRVVIFLSLCCMQQSPCTYFRYQYSRKQKKTTSPFSNPILRLYGQNCSDYNLQESQRLSLNSHIFLFFPNLCRTMIEKRVCIKTKTAVLIIRAPEYFRVFWKHSLSVYKRKCDSLSTSPTSLTQSIFLRNTSASTVRAGIPVQLWLLEKHDVTKDSSVLVD